MKKGFTLIELLAVIIILGVISLIVAPIVNNTVENSKRKAFIQSLKGIIKATQIYQGDNNFASLPVNGINVDDNIIEISNVNNYESGVIYEEDNKVYLERVSNGDFCGTGTLDDLLVTEGPCVTTSDSCFDFDEDTGTILYYDKSCELDVVIPTRINNILVEHIGGAAFVDAYDQECTADFNDWTVVGMSYNHTEDDGYEACYYSIDDTQDITSVIFPRSLKTIGQSAFAENALTSLTLPDSIYSIADDAFYSNQIEELRIPKSLTEISAWVFEENNISSLDFSDATNLTYIDSEAFINNNLSELDISKLTSLETIVAGAFCDNNFVSFADIELPKQFNNSSYDAMIESAFCIMLNS